MYVDTTKVNPEILNIVKLYEPAPILKTFKSENFKFDKKKILFKNTKLCSKSKYLITISKLERDV
jgi:hypothetical protein